MSFRTARPLVAAVILIHCCAHGIPLDNFYTFGAGAADAALPPNDDDFSDPINLTQPAFRFFDEVSSAIFVSYNNYFRSKRGARSYGSMCIIRIDR